MNPHVGHSQGEDMAAVSCSLSVTPCEGLLLGRDVVGARTLAQE